jgi:Flp pilus assembly protein CpaB
LNLGRVILIVVAIAVAGGAAFLVKYLMDKQRDDAKTAGGSSIESIEVLVADRPLSRGVITTPEHYVWAKWPADKINPNYIVRKKSIKVSDFVGQAV